MRWFIDQCAKVIRWVAKAHESPPAPEPAPKVRTLASLPGLHKQSPEFHSALLSAANRMGCDPNHLSTILCFESAGTFSPTIRHPVSGATGILQWMPTAADYCGTTIEELLEMTNVEQLFYVEAFFHAYVGRKELTLDSMYVLVLAGRWVESPETVLFRKGTPQYTQNSHFDRTKKGYITAADATKNLHTMLDRSLRSRPMIWVEEVEG